jgi:hypothetical protein
MPEWLFAPATDSTGVFGVDQGVPVTICCRPYGGSIIVLLQVLRLLFVKELVYLFRRFPV